MQIENAKVGEATVTLSTAELRFLCGAITETLNAIREREFRTRTGETRERAKEIWDQLISILKKTKEPS